MGIRLIAECDNCGHVLDNPVPLQRHNQGWKLNMSEVGAQDKDMRESGWTFAVIGNEHAAFCRGCARAFALAKTGAQTCSS